MAEQSANSDIGEEQGEKCCTEYECPEDENNSGNSNDSKSLDDNFEQMDTSELVRRAPRMNLFSVTNKQNKEIISDKPSGLTEELTKLDVKDNVPGKHGAECDQKGDKQGVIGLHTSDKYSYGRAASITSSGGRPGRGRSRGSEIANWRARQDDERIASDRVAQKELDGRSRGSEMANWRERRKQDIPESGINSRQKYGFERDTRVRNVHQMSGPERNTAGKLDRRIVVINKMDNCREQQQGDTDRTVPNDVYNSDNNSRQRYGFEREVNQIDVHQRIGPETLIDIDHSKQDHKQGDVGRGGYFQQRGGFRRNDNARHGGDFEMNQNKIARGHTTTVMYPIGIRKLKEIAGMESEEDILFRITNSRGGFAEVLETTMDTYTFETIICIISKVLKCQSLSSAVLQLLVNIKDSKFFKTSINEYLSKVMVMPVSPHRKYIVSKSILSCLILMQNLVDRIPSSSQDVFAVFAVLDATLASIDKDEKNYISAEIDAVMDEVKSGCERNIIKQNESRIKKNFDKDLREPPDDFRLIPVIPTEAELEFNEKPFIRANKSLGSFKDLDQYLDIHFRLLREDFVRPLREGIALYLKQKKDPYNEKRNTDVRMYSGVTIQHSVCHNKILAHSLCFNVKGLGHLDWELSSRLIFGSLLCLSDDDFQTMLFATIVDRSNIKTGNIIVHFENAEQRTDRLTERGTFIMAETTTYFEAYRHILEGLQQIRTIPFTDYIVLCSANVKRPSYLQEDAIYSLQSLIVSDDTKTEKDIGLAGHLELSNTFKSATTGNKGQANLEHSVTAIQSTVSAHVNVYDPKTWPESQLLGLDDVQFSALQSAITSEFSIIQGPPGTGKTYLGLKLLKVLLQNKSAWSGDNTDQHIPQSPILVVCYTNHALDQFLEGIEKDISKKIVRLGGRTKSETVKKYTLYEKRPQFQQDNAYLKNAFRDLRNSTMEDEMRIKSINSDIKTSYEEVLHEAVLRLDMDIIHYRSLTEDFHQQDRKSVSIIRDWLDIEPNSVGISNDDDENDTQDENCTVNVETNITFMVDDRIQDEYDKSYEKVKIKGSILTCPYKRIAHGFRLTNKLISDDVMADDEINDVQDVWTLAVEDRWRLYRLWITRFRHWKQQTIRDIEMAYDRNSQRYREIQTILDIKLLNTCDVIGMTTTGAAKYRNILQAVDPKIIIVEEAAEVLESHIVTSLTQGCQHLILIGDHKQLRPSPTVYELAKRYNLNLSLFERMVNNGVPCHTLINQHRMRPEIADIMRIVYPDLKDHPSVVDRHFIKGMEKPVFFVNHKYQETEDTELLSKENAYEAEFVTRLCKYLLQQGYNTSQISVLTPYTGQILKLRKLLQGPEFKGLRICAVDNFQGEENEIILLSLVRSNEDGKLGFLSEENRVCVALSRARLGMYVIGNFDMFAAKNKKWEEIVNHVKTSGMFGQDLTLQCQNHPMEKGEIRSASDFAKSPEGGCLKPCDFILECGHVCDLKCHPYDPEHNKYVCVKPCAKMCKSNLHRCQKLCHENCGSCWVKVTKTVPYCRHEQSVPCFLDPEEHICAIPCVKVLGCGHPCSKVCGKPHSYQCQVKVTRQLACGHDYSSKCYETPSKYNCLDPCKQLLACGHTCKGRCGECHQGRLHIGCTLCYVYCAAIPGDIRKLELQIQRTFSDADTVSFLTRILIDPNVGYNTFEKHDRCTHRSNMVECLLQVLHNLYEIQSSGRQLKPEYRNEFNGHINEFKGWCLKQKLWAGKQPFSDVSAEEERLRLLCNAFKLKGEWDIIRGRISLDLQKEFVETIRVLKSGEALGKKIDELRTNIEEIETLYARTGDDDTVSRI